MKKKGFTLIELLAVIALIAILVITATPKVINIFKNAKREAFKISVSGIVSSGKYLYMTDPSEYIFTYTEGVESNTHGKNLKYSGEKPKIGIVFIDSESNIAVALHNGTYCATKPSDKSEIDIKEVTVGNCTTYRIIHTNVTWLEIAEQYDLELEELLTLNENDGNGSTIGLDIKIPIYAASSDSGEVPIQQVTDSTPGTFAGTGTATEPFLIESIEDLVALSSNVNGGNTYAGKYIYLTISLDFKNPISYVDSNTIIYGDINGNGIKEGLLVELTTESGFNPIGNGTIKFSGYLSGNLNTINNLYIKRETTDYVGLFGYLKNGTITALNLNNIDIKGNNFTGGITGYVENGNLNESLVKGKIAGNDYVGLVIGQSYSYNYPSNHMSLIAEGNVSGNNCIGGLAGRLYNYVGQVISFGGIFKGGNVTSIGANVGRIVGDSSKDWVGGYSILSGIAVSSTKVNNANITNLDFSTINGTEIENISELNNINLAELVLDTYIGGDNDNNGYYWDFNSNAELVQKNVKQYPLTISFSSGDGSIGNPYLINNYNDLIKATVYLNKAYKLNSDIDLSGKNFYMLGSYRNNFTGKFDGNQKTIKNLTINVPGGSYIGFSGYNRGTITGINFENIFTNGYNFTGGIVGYNNNGHVNENSVTGNVTGNNYVGLVAGYFHNWDYPGRNTSNIVEGNVTGNNYIGGIAGYAFNQIAQPSYLTGVNNGGSVTSIGANVGRIVGGLGKESGGAYFNTSSLAKESVKINGSTKTDFNPTSINGNDFNNSTDLNNLNLAEIGLDTYIGGDNDNNGYYWDYDLSGNLVRKTTAQDPLTFVFSSGDGSESNPYIINNYDELKRASQNPTLYYKLNSNIDLNGKNFYMLGSFLNKFTGKFDGNGKTISSLIINEPYLSYVGFTGYSTGTISGLTLNNVDIIARDYVGAISGFIYKGSVNDNIISGNVDGNNNVGLVAGQIYNDRTSPKITSVIVEGNVTGNNNVGGIVGLAHGYNASACSINGININDNIIIKTTGKNAGRIAGASTRDYGSYFAINSKALFSITVKGITVTSADATTIQGADITTSDLSLDITYTNLGFNFTDETLDYIWYIDNGIAKVRPGNS